MDSRIRYHLVFLPVLIVLFLTTGVGSVCYSQEDEITIENEAAYKKKQRPPVLFTHEIHMEILECLDCHHVYENGENVLDDSEISDEGEAKCASCHIGAASIGTEQAYHRQCIGCHRQTNREEGLRLPVTCGQCHIRPADDTP